jgi:hypothetical protein
VSHLPSVVAAELTVRFSRAPSPAELERFFRSLAQALFDLASERGSFLGHIKIFAEAARSAYVRANLPGDRQSVRVELRNVRNQRVFRLAVNVIAYRVSAGTLRERLPDVLARTTRRFGTSLSQLHISAEHTH